MKFTDKVRKQIETRSKGRCEVCGSLALYHQIHHRRPRGMGGSTDEACGTAANGIWVHPGCHAKIESNREQALAKGWLVPQGKNPAEVPFKKYNQWVLLLDDGTMVPSPQDSLSGG